jgi:hypothetical protein
MPFERNASPVSAVRKVHESRLDDGTGNTGFSILWNFASGAVS